MPVDEVEQGELSVPCEGVFGTEVIDRQGGGVHKQGVGHGIRFLTRVKAPPILPLGVTEYEKRFPFIPSKLWLRAITNPRLE